MTTTGNSDLCGYGKLPASREYVRVRCDRGAALVFREFLDQAASYILKGANSDDPLRLLITLPNRQGTIAAAVWRSSDAGGHRPFPFSFFTGLDPVGREEWSPGFWNRLQPVFLDLLRPFAGAKACRDRAALERSFGPSGPTVGPLLAAEEARRRQGEAAAAILVEDLVTGAFGDAGEKFGAALWRLEGFCRGAGRIDGTPGGVQLPLTGLFPLEVQVDAWLELLAGRATWPVWPPDMVVSPLAAGSRSTLTLIFRPLVPADMAMLGAGGVVGRLANLAVFREPEVLEGFGAYLARAQALIAAGLTLDRLHELMEVIP